MQSEATCALINTYGRDPHIIDSSPLSESFEALIHRARHNIKKCLGSFSWDEAERSFGFTSGASTGHTRRTGAPFYKFQGNLDVTLNNRMLAVCSIWTSPLWRAKCQDISLDPFNWVNVVPGSIWTTVPKTAFIDRGICKEADMDMYVQRGIGACIRSRLRRAGIDLNDQTRNGYLAKIGSITGALVTIDLASASDSIALELVRDLLPPDWFDACARTRAAYTRMPNGKYHRLEKISSMGNGYTFELESLIFWGLTKAVVDVLGCEDDRIGIYGDDIICHNSVASKVIDLLAYCGFKTNVDKTFVKGPFRESCGKHYYHGSDVTPFYVKESLEPLNRRYWFINALRLWIRRTGQDEASWRSTVKYVVKLLLPNPALRTTVPPNFSSEAGLYVGDSSQSNTVYLFSSRRFGGGGYRIRPLIAMRTKKAFRPNGIYALLSAYQDLYTRSDTGVMAHLGEPVTSRLVEKGEVTYRRKTAVTTQWSDLDIAFGCVHEL